MLHSLHSCIVLLLSIRFQLFQTVYVLIQTQAKNADFLVYPLSRYSDNDDSALHASIVSKKLIKTKYPF